MKVRIIGDCFAILFLAIAWFVLPVRAESIQLVSGIDSSLAPSAGGGDSCAPIISPDGRYVLFASTANNLALISSNSTLALSPARMNVYLRDRSNGMTTLVSANVARTGGGNGDSWPKDISTDGRYALFESSASDLVAGDTNNVSDVFVRDLAGNLTLLVSVSTNGGIANGISRSPVMTPDGRRVAFVSTANNLVPNDTNNIADVFLRDLPSGTTLLASVGARNPPGSITASSESPDLTPDGRYVAFYSTATNLVPGARAVGEIFVRDLFAGTTVWTSSNALSKLQSVTTGTKAVSFNHSISADGRFVAYEATTNTASIPSGRGIILRFDQQTGLTDLVFTNANVPALSFESARSLDMTSDGRFIAFVANTNGTSGATTCIYLWDAQTRSTTLLSGDLNNNVPINSFCDSPVIDATGRFVAFLSSATNLTTNPLTADYHLYVRDVQAGSTTLVDADTNGVGSISISPATAPRISADGRYVAFECPDGGLVPNDNNRAYDVFVRDLTASTNELISVRNSALLSQTANGNSGLFTFAVSTNGRFAAFVSEANNLVVNDTNGVSDIVVRDLLTGLNLLVSVGTNGGCSDSPSTEPTISGDGRFVTFTSGADNLIANDANKAPDVFLRDLLTGATALVSASNNGTNSGNGASYSAVVSADGSAVMFRSQAKNLTAGSFTGTDNLFWRDMLAGTNYALTTSGAATAAAMSPDGRFVAFGGSTAKIFVWDSLSHAQVYSNQTATVISGVAINADGTHIAYTTGSGPASLYGVDRLADTNWVIGTGYFSSHSGLRFSGDGRLLTYAMTRTPSPTGTNDIFLYDFQSGTNQLVSRSYMSSSLADGSSDSPDLSADGRFVAFRSFASNLVPGDSNNVPDVFLYDVQNKATTLLSANQSGNSTANNRSLSPRFTADGQTLFFQSWASDLIAQDFNQLGEVMAFKLFPSGTGTTNSTSLFLGEFVFVGGNAVNNPTLTWTASPGAAYRVQFKNDLSDPAWQDVNGLLTLVGMHGSITDFTPAASQRFYRLVVENP